MILVIKLYGERLLAIALASYSRSLRLKSRPGDEVFWFIFLMFFYLSSTTFPIYSSLVTLPFCTTELLQVRSNKQRIYKYEIHKQIIRRVAPNMEENIKTQFREEGFDCRMDWVAKDRRHHPDFNLDWLGEVTRYFRQEVVRQKPEFNMEADKPSQSVWCKDVQNITGDSPQIVIVLFLGRSPTLIHFYSI
jgi:hypothetical protein